MDYKEKLALTAKKIKESDLGLGHITPNLYNDYAPQLLVESSYEDIQYLIRLEGEHLHCYAYMLKNDRWRSVIDNISGIKDVEHMWSNIYEFFEIHGYDRFEAEYKNLHNIINIINQKEE